MTRQPTAYLAAPDGGGLYNAAAIARIWTVADEYDPHRWAVIAVDGRGWDRILEFQSANRTTAKNIDVLAEELIAEIAAADGAVIEWTGTGWRTRSRATAEVEGGRQA